MEERATGDFVVGRTIILTAPANFQFNSGATPTATVALLAGSLGSCFTLSAPTVTSTTITFTVTAADAGPGSGYCRVTFGNIQVRPTAMGRPTGTLTNAGTQLPNGATNYGTLTVVQGTVTSWQSYNAGCAVANATFNGTSNVLCLRGTAPVTTASYYRVVIYDGAGAQVLTDTPLTANPTLQSGDHPLSSYPSATSGTWRAVVYPATGLVTPEMTYAGTSPEIRAVASFTVTAAALPALPTPLAALLASGGAGGLYAFFRKRMLRGRT
jgi:hypothetical protein